MLVKSFSRIRDTLALSRLWQWQCEMMTTRDVLHKSNSGATGKHAKKEVSMASSGDLIPDDPVLYTDNTHRHSLEPASIMLVDSQFIHRDYYRLAFEMRDILLFGHYRDHLPSSLKRKLYSKIQVKIEGK